MATNLPGPPATASAEAVAPRRGQAVQGCVVSVGVVRLFRQCMKVAEKLAMRGTATRTADGSIDRMATPSPVPRPAMAMSTGSMIGPGAGMRRTTEANGSHQSAVERKNNGVHSQCHGHCIFGTPPHHDHVPQQHRLENAEDAREAWNLEAVSESIVLVNSAMYATIIKEERTESNDHLGV